MRIVVFLGPTLPISAARRILPDARYLPPARQGDVLSAVYNERPDVIALIDGTFRQSLSVWHKEILFALDRGVAVFGASSMGALRAAECREFGMVGIGTIAEWYSTGVLTRDDEVAVAHADAEHDYRPTSTALVDIRATLAAATHADACEHTDVDRLLELAAGRDYPDRSWEQLFSDGLAAGMASARVDVLRSFVADRRVEQKRLDAEELLRTLRDLKQPPQAGDWEFNETVFFRSLLARDRTIERRTGTATMEQIARFVLTHRRDATALAARALHREMLVLAAREWGIAVDDGDVDVEIQRFSRERRWRGADDQEAFLARNDLDAERFRVLMHKRAQVRAVRRWLRARRSIEGVVEPVLDELRLADEFASWADQAAGQERLLGEEYTEFADVDDEIELDELLRRTVAANGWLPDAPLDVWAVEHGFHDGYDLRLELVRGELARRAFRRVRDREADDRAN